MIGSNELQIVNYCHPHCEPFLNICRLPEAEAFALARRMSDSNPGITAFGRFADFENYYPRRMKQDEYLFDSFVRLGGKPIQTHPLSFVLQGSPYLDGWFGNGITSRVLLAGIPAEAISFTLGDSMAMQEKHGAVVMHTKDSLLNFLDAYAGTVDEFLAEIAGTCRYIEAQLWDDDYCKKQG